MRTLLLLLLLPCTVLAGPSTAPYHATAMGVGLAGPRSLKWDPISRKTATQPQRESIIWALNNLVMPTVIRTAKKVSNCGGTVTSVIGVQNRWTTKLGVVYPIDLGLASIGTWQYRETIYDYGNAQGGLEQLQYCMLANNGYSCAKALADPTTSPNDVSTVLAALSMGVVFDDHQLMRCIKIPPPPFVPAELFSPTRSQDGIWTTKVKPRALTTTQLQLLSQLELAHMQSTTEKCGGAKATLSVGVTRDAFEASAVDEAQHAFFRLFDFAGDKDPLHTAAEQCAIAQLEHTEMHTWANGIRELNQLKVWIHNTAHAFHHGQERLKDSRVLYRIPCTEKLQQGCPVAP